MRRMQFSVSTGWPTMSVSRDELDRNAPVITFEAYATFNVHPTDLSQIDPVTILRQLRLPQEPADRILLQFDVLRVPKIHQHMAWG